MGSLAVAIRGAWGYTQTRLTGAFTFPKRLQLVVYATVGLLHYHYLQWGIREERPFIMSTAESEAWDFRSAQCRSAHLPVDNIDRI